MTTLAEARRLADVAERARHTHQIRHVEAHETGPVADGVDLPDAPAFYVVRKRLAAGSTSDGQQRAAPQWTVVHAAATQGDAVAWVDGDLPREDGGTR